MLCSGVRKCLALAIGVVFFAGCGGGAQSAGSSIDKLPEAEKAKVIQNTMQNTMEKNQQAMEQQGMQAPAGTTAPGGFQPPDSMKKYMNKQGGGAQGGGANAPGSGAPAGGGGTTPPPS